MKNKLSKLSKILLIIAAAALITSLFVPIWSIYLDAPQYPEGLSLQIWANAIAGDVDIINGLNHYIGMKTLHTKDFIEFTVLPYIIIAFALFFLVAALIARKGLLYAALIAFILFGVVSMIDFWKWEYDYGHNLDPNAAIKVPGMAYQPPLIGFKQLLNFGAYSIPDIGGWLFVVAGFLLLLATLKEWKFSVKKSSQVTSTLLVLFTVFFASCAPKGAAPIHLNSDACESCKMTISDGRFAAEIITQKGRVYKYDDVHCLFHHLETTALPAIAHYYIHDFTKNNELIDAQSAWYVQDENLKSPMGGNTAAFTTQEAANSVAQKYNTQVMSWSELKQQLQYKQQGNEMQH